MPEDRLPISSSRLSPGDVTRHTFGHVRRGFDPAEVRSFLELVSRELVMMEQREHDLRNELADAGEQARHPVLDEATLSATLGRQSAAVLRSAHDEASGITTAAEEAATAIAHHAQRRATEVQVEAEAAAAERIAAAELASSAIRHEVDGEVAALLEAARAECEELLAQARQQGRALVERAQLARREVLADLAKRRRFLHSQIDQYRAARDELATAVLGVRSSVDAIVTDLAHADDDARAAAADVARRSMSDLAGIDTEELERAEPAGATGSEGVAVLAEVVFVSDGAGDGVNGTGIGVHDAAEPAADLARAEARETASVEDLFARIRAGQPDAADGGPGAGDLGDADDGAGAPTPVAAAAGDAAATAADDAAATAADDAAAPAAADAAAPAAGDAAAPAAGDAATVADDATVDDDAIARLADDHVAPVAEDTLGAAAEDAAGGGAEGEAGAEGAGDVDAGAGAEREGPDGALVRQRADLLDPVVARLTRRVKRALQDDQNRLLHAIRSGSGRLSEEVLAPEAEQRATLVEASSRLLVEAYAAGSAFARAGSGAGARPARGGRSTDQRAGAVARTRADELSAAVVSQLRRRLVADGGDGPAGGADEVAERVGAAYREWRGERIERLVGDAAVGAFSAGTLAAASGPLRWLPTNGGAACPDCDDNSLAGAVGSGQEFPTGHPYPPAHPGCRCLVAPTTA
jgi:DivIVA domain-containing protein